ncbi:hypothetical protein [Hallella mizrahii]|uniref:Uncharacterized protein n=1 Tax=Hallella mizrahii TaxID=2606637 RepID=A0A7K0KGU2_9BACT|nr:hypothetical protein [Hallella mizrahii]MST84670.1 hypothetical protein [Hallella mizrahii]
MSKQSFINEIKEYKRNGGVISFAYGDHRLPVVYQEDSDVIRVNMSQYDVFMPVDYQINLFDNLANLQDKLLEKYPQLLQ